MSTPLRKKSAHKALYALLALTMVGLGGYGAVNFSSGAMELGHVGQRKISVNEYSRALRREIQAFSAQIGKPVSFQDAQAMGIDTNVLQQIVSGATLEDEAARLGVSVGDGQVRDQITSAPALQGPDGKFSRLAYDQYLTQAGQSGAEFENQLRAELSRTVVQGAVLGGMNTSDALADRLTAWTDEKRNFTYAPLTAANLPTPIPAPTEDQVKAWYDGHHDSYMKPETRKISYVWLKPEDLVDQVQVDDATLKQAYDQHKADYQQPERRLVSRLVFPTDAEAQAAKARLDKGEVTFEGLVKERGLTLDDVDLGENTKEQLGAAGDAVFALTAPGVTGPAQSDLGPALFSMNGILQAQITTFEQAKPELKTEVAIDRARRMIGEKNSEIEDMLASGASLEQIAKDAGMTFGKLDYNSESEGGLAGYEAFRKTADAATTDSFPTLVGLDDGGVFAMQLDAIEAPVLKPLDQVRDQVIADWTKDATHSALVALAGEDIAQIQNGATIDSFNLAAKSLTDFARGGFVDGVSPAVGNEVFAMAAGEVKVVDADGAVYLVRLDAIDPVDLTNADAQAKRTKIRGEISQAMGRDLFALYIRAIQSGTEVAINQQAVNAVNAQMR